MSSEPIENQVPAYIREIRAYQPGRPIEEVERELGIRAIKLASNENPLGPSPLAVEAARRAAADSNWYPDGSGYYLRRKLSERLGVEMDALMLGGGSCELIDLAARTPLNVALTGEDHAWSFVFLASDRSRGMTGETVHNDAGFGLGAPR